MDFAEALGGRRIEIPVDEGDVLTEVIIIAKAVQWNEVGSGKAAVIIATEDNLDWIQQLGLIEAALQVIRQTGLDD